MDKLKNIFEGINNTKENFGKMKSHGCSFDIKETGLKYLFEKI